MDDKKLNKEERCLREEVHKLKTDLFDMGTFMELARWSTLGIGKLRMLHQLCEKYDFAQGSFNIIVNSYVQKILSGDMIPGLDAMSNSIEQMWVELNELRFKL